MMLHPSTPRSAFTRIELCVVLSVLAVLAGLVLPALAREQSRNWRAACLLRMGLLAKAVSMYAVDNGDYLPPNPDDGNTTPGKNWCPGVAGVGGSAEYNPDVLRDTRRAMLTSYLDGDVSVYRCPLDSRMGKYTGTNTLLQGTQTPAARTVSLSGAVGTNPNVSGGKQPVNGPWLDGRHNHTANKTWYCYARTADFIQPGPARTFTFVEEDVHSLNDGGFSCVGPSDPFYYYMIDYPGPFHETAGVVAFADGHTELHRWVDNRTLIKNKNVTAQMQPGNADLEWLARRASARIVP